jgi:hypothetical protein
MTSELEELQRAIHDTITNLFKLSMMIRQPTPRGRYSASKSMAPFDPMFDIAHVWHKFPHARQNPWLVERLGRAITRRREYFRYRREHRRRLAGQSHYASGTVPGDIGKLEPLKEHNSKGTRTLEIEHKNEKENHSITLTKATTFVDTPREQGYVEEPDNGSVTSYATSTGDNSVHVLRVPDPPEFSGREEQFEYGMPFECPYCFTIQAVENWREWKYVFVAHLHSAI